MNFTKVPPVGLEWDIKSPRWDLLNKNFLVDKNKRAKIIKICFYLAGFCGQRTKRQTGRHCFQAAGCCLVAALNLHLPRHWLVATKAISHGRKEIRPGSGLHHHWTSDCPPQLFFPNGTKMSDDFLPIPIFFSI